MSLDDFNLLFTCERCGFKTKKEEEAKKHEAEAKHSAQRWLVEGPGRGSRAKEALYSNEALESKAKAFAECLVELVNGVGQTFYNILLDDAPIEKRNLWAIELELIFLCLFFTDVMVFQSHGAEKRKVFMDALGFALPDLLAKEFQQEDSAEDFGATFFESLNLRQMRYSECRDLFPAEGESLENTLFWEFGKIMGAVYGCNNPVQLVLVSHTASGMYEPLVKTLRILKVVPPHQEGDGLSYEVLSKEDEVRFREKPYEPLLKLKSSWPPARKFDK